LKSGKQKDLLPRKIISHAKKPFQYHFISTIMCTAIKSGHPNPNQNTTKRIVKPHERERRLFVVVVVVGVVRFVLSCIQKNEGAWL